ncbi:hypothetical protein E2C01_004278 [Portunus trituberculatus]|uniref:Uncharacterized protein n=1 Tax=Portunus trituberculatus TaxID=210409 RepID=A0A5B7CR78_PORTR|nr:hypothetical protein [Portunus trituberculatus]
MWARVSALLPPPLSAAAACQPRPLPFFSNAREQVEGGTGLDACLHHSVRSRGTQHARAVDVATPA